MAAPRGRTSELFRHPQCTIRKMYIFLNEKYLGIVAIALLVTGLVFLIRKWPKDIHHTFSQHAAANRTSTIYYATLFAVILPILAIFFFSWFVPVHNVPSVFSILVALSLVCQLACTLVPEVGKYVKTHQALAGISGLLLLPALLMCIFASNIGMIDRAIIVICCATMTLVLLLVVSKRTRYALILQAMYFTAFFAPILVISYI